MASILYVKERMRCSSLQSSRKTKVQRFLVLLNTLILSGRNIFIALNGNGILTDDKNERREKDQYDLPQHQQQVITHEYANTNNSTIIQLPPFTAQESFGACALVLNQNHRFTEWIAYHYFALPLRTLFVAYDPKSTQRATHLLQRWTKVIDIIEWEEDDYLPANWSDDIIRNGPYEKPLERVIHENRQVYFMQQCTLALAAKNVSRVIHHDVDEYLRINTDIVKGYDTSRPGHITQFLNHETTDKVRWLPNASCWLFVRLYFTPLKEDSPTERQSIYKHMDYPWLQPAQLDTLRYRYRKKRAQQTGKGILQLNHEDVSSTAIYRREDVLEKWMKVHNPLGKPLCHGPWPIGTSPLLLNHYLGSYETYRFAAQWDPRFQNDTEWERRMARGKGAPQLDDVITHWVHVFVAWQSEAVARELLSDAGWRDEYASSSIQ